MKTRSLIFESRQYRTDAAPPNAFEDCSRFGNHGAFTNSPAWTRLASGLWVLSLNGNNSYANLSTAASLNLTDGITLIAWLRPTDLNANQNIVFVGARAAPPWNSWLMDLGDTKGLARLYLNIAGVDQKINFAAGSELPIGKFTMAVGTWKSGDNLRLYRNGALNALSALTYSGAMPAVTSKAAVGFNTASSAFYGDVGGARILNGAFSDAEVYALFQRERGWYDA